MVNFNVSRMPERGSFSSRVVLASGPFVLALACNVYDDSLLGSSRGGGSSGGAAGMTFGGTMSESGKGGADGGGTSSAAGSAGQGSDGMADSAGSATGGVTSGAGSSGEAANAGNDTGGQPPSDHAVVDDMEDTDAQINVDGGRDGYWYVGNDGTVGGMQQPTSAKFEMFELGPRDHDDSTYSTHMKVSGFTGWGSVIGFNLVEQQTAVKAYDASAFCGVQFWGKALAATSLRLRLPDGDTHPDGGVCKETGAANTLCYDHFSAPIALTTAWKSFSIAFSTLEQTGTGYHPADDKFKAEQLYAMEWALPGAAGKAYEIWIDDITLTACP
jgi:hypothetical protein